MTDAASHSLRDFFTTEDRLRRRWSAAAAIAAILAITGLVLQHLLLVGVSLVGVGIAHQRSRRLKASLIARLQLLLQRIEVHWDDIEHLDMKERYIDPLLTVLTPEPGQQNTNVEHLRTRGGDEKGPSFGERVEAFSPDKSRQDPDEHAPTYEGLEGPLARSETMVHAADEAYASEAQRRWKEAEQSDPDMIEAGVERLGDLVASGWFERNAEEGAVARAMEKGRTSSEEHLL